jgi:hypothetical protein
MKIKGSRKVGAITLEFYYKTMWVGHFGLEFYRVAMLQFNLELF